MAYVCLCNGVSDHEVAAAIESGAESICQVGAICGAGTGCHGCHDTIDDMIEARVSVRARHLAIA